MLGIDEAGRGPVIGSMFVACVEANEQTIPDAVKDSKQLSNTRVRELATQILDHPDIRVVAREITADHIDNTPQSLSELTADAMSELIDTRLQTHDLDDTVEVMVDAGHSSAETYREIITEKLDYNTPNTHIRSEHRADENHAVVSAAGIIAKSLRESHINELHENGASCGSGYPGDPTTIEYVKNVVERNEPVPSIVRESWSTVEDLRDQAQQTSFSDYNTNK